MLRKLAIAVILALPLTFMSLGPFGFWSVNQAAAEPSHVVISQIQVTGGSGHTTEDFVELFNPTATAFNLSGHRLVKRTATGASDTTIKSWTTSTLIPAYGFYLWANTAFTTIAVTPDASTSESIADNNSVALRHGAADTGEIIDAVGWGTATNALVEGTAFATNPATNESIARLTPSQGSRQDAENNSTDFTLQPAASPHSSASPAETPVGTPGGTGGNSSGGGGNSLGSTPSGPKPGEVVINELVSDPTDGEEEWIELYNRSGRVIDLNNWTLNEGSGTKTALTGSLGVDSTSQYLVIRSPKGNLNNDGDIVKLTFGDTVIDQVSYGSWNDGSINDNAPAATDPNGTGRLPDGTDTDQDGKDFAITLPTPGKPNTGAVASEPSTATKAAASIGFNEVYPNPPLGDEHDEFIELINLGSKEIDLKNWILADEITTYIIAVPDAVVYPGKLLLLPRPVTSLALDNEGTEHLTLTSPDTKVKIKLSYTGPAHEGVSYARSNQNTWTWTTQTTPGLTNVITPLNAPPHAVLQIPKQGSPGTLLVFDASDSIDPEGTTLSFAWDFGDGYVSQVATPSHAFATAGKYSIKVEVKDAVGASATESSTVTISSTATTPTVLGSSNGPIELSELIPNPTGSDTAEWIELYNPATEIVSTSGWKLAVGTHITTFPNLVVPAEGYLVVQKQTGKFTLTNAATTVKLLAPQGNTVNEVNYTQAPEGQSYARFGNIWAWSDTPTPGEENIDSQSNSTNNNDGYENLTLSEVRGADHGSHIRTTGTVTAAPGLLGKNITFIAEGETALQLSLSGQVLPTLKLGDRLSVAGTVSKSSTGTKLLVRNPKFITILSAGIPPLPTTVTIGDVDETYEARLINLTGKVSKFATASFVLAEGDNSLRVILKNREQTWPKAGVAQTAAVVGFVTLTSAGPVLWARSPTDITLSAATPTVAGASDEKPVDLSQTQPSQAYAGYLVLGALALFLVGTYMWEKKKLPWLAATMEKIKNHL